MSTTSLSTLILFVAIAGYSKSSFSENQDFSIASQDIFICKVCETIVLESLGISEISSTYEKYPSARVNRSRFVGDSIT
jgi:hypothetical protein